MPLGALLQQIIHIITVGAGSRVLRVVMLGTIIFTIWLSYDLCDFKNFSAPEAMDSAQLARNLSEGRGYTTDFVRPLSIYLVQKRSQARNPGRANVPSADFARLQTRHPDLANPPVYPLFLAGCMKVLPFRYVATLKRGFWAQGGQFSRYEPDFLIALINQLLLAAVIWQTFLLARKLFDQEAAWISAALVFSCEQLWEFSVSGLSTVLLLVIFLGLVRVVVAYEEAARAFAAAADGSPRRLFGLAVAAGLLTGLGALTRYSFGWMMLPVMVFMILLGGRERARPILCAFAAFFLLLGPWMLRNYRVSGTPFGTAGFAIMEASFYFPQFKLERSLSPDLTKTQFIFQYIQKLGSNLTSLVQVDLPTLGRSWVVLLFFTGLLTPFRGVAARRLRYFLLMSLAVLAVCQALGRTQLSVVSPVVNSENLLVLGLPVILIYGTVFFLTILQQTRMPLLVPKQTVKVAAISVFIVVMSFPMIATLMAGRSNPVAYPPYYPPEIQKASNWMKENELTMSDVPWAVAWYGHRQCVWLTLNANDDYYAVNDYLKPIHALYLTSLTMDSKFRSECLDTPDDSWGKIVLNASVKQYTLPLTSSPDPLSFGSGLFLTDRPRWLGPGL